MSMKRCVILNVYNLFNVDNTDYRLSHAFLLWHMKLKKKKCKRKSGQLDDSLGLHLDLPPGDSKR